MRHTPRLKNRPNRVDVIEVERLWELYRDLGNSLDLDETLSILDRALARLILYHAISVHLEDEKVTTCAYAAGHDFAHLAANPPHVPHAGLPVTLQAALPGAGILSLYRTQPPEFSPEDRDLLRALAPKLSSSIQNARRFRRAQAANQRALFERLDAEISRTRRSHGRLAVIECAVTGLDPAGLAAGRLRATLRNTCREYDFVAPVEGGFLIVLPDFAPSAQDETKSRIQSVFLEAGLHATIGAAHFPLDGYDTEDLLAAAHGAAHA